MPVNTEFINKVADAIEANEEHFDMTLYINWKEVDEGWSLDEIYELSGLDESANSEVAEAVVMHKELMMGSLRCGSGGCIAGWGCIVAEPEDLDLEGGVHYNTMRLMGLEEAEADSLFLRYIRALNHTKVAVKALRLIARGFQVEAAIESARIEFGIDEMGWPILVNEDD